MFLFIILFSYTSFCDCSSRGDTHISADGDASPYWTIVLGGCSLRVDGSSSRRCWPWRVVRIASGFTRVVGRLGGSLRRGVNGPLSVAHRCPLRVNRSLGRSSWTTYHWLVVRVAAQLLRHYSRLRLLIDVIAAIDDSANSRCAIVERAVVP